MSAISIDWHVPILVAFRILVNTWSYYNTSCQWRRTGGGSAYWLISHWRQCACVHFLSAMI